MLTEVAHIKVAGWAKTCDICGQRGAPVERHDIEMQVGGHYLPTTDTVFICQDRDVCLAELEHRGLTPRQEEG